MGFGFGKSLVKVLCGLLAMVIAFGLVACGGKNQPVEQPAASTTPQPEPEPEPGFDATTSAYLTGLEKTADYPAGQRAVAVMVGNNRESRPHRGLSEATILVEAIVDSYWITRLVAVYEDYTTMPTVQPVRSARDHLYQVVAPMYPFFIHDGPGDLNQPVYQMMREVEAQDFDMYINGRVGAATRFDGSGVYTWHEYTNSDMVQDTIDRFDMDWRRDYGSPLFNFVPYTEPVRVPETGSATEVMIVHNDSNRTGLSWNGSQYVLSMNSGGSMQTLTDRNNDAEVAFDNCLVLFAPMSLYSNSVLVKVDYSGGVGYYFSQGSWEPLYWEKGGVGSPIRLMNLYNLEESLQINPGTTYIAIVNEDNIEAFDESLRTGSADDGNIPDADGDVD